MKEEAIALMYLAEETSPEDYKLSNLNIVNEMGATWASFDAVLHSFDVLNRNRRMYDGDNTWKCIETSDRIQDGIRKRGWYGEMDHPGQDYTNMALTAERVQKIFMPNRSHAIINPRREGNLLISRIETCPGTEAGLGMARDMVRGLIPSFSCRSIATMKFRGSKPYVEVKKIITYDWVLYPSHKEAEMISKPELNNGKQKILLESADSGMYPSSFSDYSKDIWIPMTEMADFTEDLINSDGNVSVVTESYDLTNENIRGFDPITGNVIIESVGATIFVNTNRDTKKKVEDFLTSF